MTPPVQIDHGPALADRPDVVDIRSPYAKSVWTDRLGEPVQVVSPDVATMAVANATYRLTGLNGFRLAVLTVPYAVKQEGHQLYFPEETLRQLRRPWVAADTLAILETQEAVIGKPQPVRRQATPGRKDPCFCGSGQKYKRCCAGTGDDGGASL